MVDYETKGQGKETRHNSGLEGLHSARMATAGQRRPNGKPHSNNAR